MLQRAWSQIRAKQDVYKLNQHRIKDYAPLYNLHTEKPSPKKNKNQIFIDSPPDSNDTESPPVSEITRQQQFWREQQARELIKANSYRNQVHQIINTGRPLRSLEPKFSTIKRGRNATPTYNE